MQRELAVGHDIRLSATRDGVVQLRPDDLTPLVLPTPEYAAALVRQYEKLKMPKTNAMVFAAALLSPNAWFVKAGEIGLIYLTDIIPEFSGHLNAVFWDQKLHRNRQEAVKTVLAAAFEKFKLQKISASAPVTNVPLKRFYRDIGFVLEGVLRRMWPSIPPSDLTVFGMLREELECQLIVKTTSLA